MLQLPQEIDALEREIEALVVRTTGQAGDYAADFAGYAADLIASAVRRGDPGALHRLEAMARTVAETIVEMGDQTTDRILESLTDIAKVLIALARAAAA